MKPFSQKLSNIPVKAIFQKYARLELFYEFETGYTSINDLSQIKTAQHALDMFKSFIISQEINLDVQEKYMVAFLNRQSRLLHIQITNTGISSMVLVDYRTIIKIALDVGASSVLLCHNHPSGNIAPSEQDIKSTKKLRSQLKLFDIVILDHVIVSPDLQTVYSLEAHDILINDTSQESDCIIV